MYCCDLKNCNGAESLGIQCSMYLSKKYHHGALGLSSLHGKFGTGGEIQIIPTRATAKTLAAWRSER